MARLIDADNLVAGIEKLKKVRIFSNTERILLNTILTVITMSKTIDPVKHGRWIFVEDMVSYIQCSECGDDICWVNTKRPKYCPSCGARMDGDAND